MVAYRPLTYGARYQEDESLRRTHEALSGGIQSEGQVVNLLVAHYRANVRALGLDRRSVRQHSHFLLHIAGLKRDVKSGNGVDLDVHTGLYGGLEAGHLDSYVVPSNGNVSDPINPFWSRDRFIDTSSGGSSHHNRRAADHRARAVNH